MNPREKSLCSARRAIPRAGEYPTPEEVIAYEATRLT